MDVSTVHYGDLIMLPVIWLVFVTFLHPMYSIKFEYTLKVRTFIEILAQNGSFKMGALLGNFSLTGS